MIKIISLSMVVLLISGCFGGGRVYITKDSFDSSVDKQERINRFGEDKSPTKEDVIKRHGNHIKLKLKVKMNTGIIKQVPNSKGF